MNRNYFYQNLSLYPLFVSPQSTSYLTGGAWSPTRPAVLLVACDTGNL